MPTGAGRVAVVLNGNARQVTSQLVESFDQVAGRGDLFLSRRLDEAHRIALDIVEAGYEVVLTGGGDGTFVQMVTSITKEARAHGRPAPRFGLLKLGTGNSLAWALGAGTSGGVFADVEHLLENDGYRNVRLIEAQDLLTPFAGAGFDALGLKHFHEVRSLLRRIPVIGKRATGAVSYAISIPALTIPELAIRPGITVRIINRGSPIVRLDHRGAEAGDPIAAGDVVFEGPCIAALVSTIPYWGFGVKVFPFAEQRPDDRFCLRVVATHPLHVAAHMRSVWKGTYRHEDLLDFYAEDVELQFDESTAIEIGGDPAGMTRSLRAHLHPEPIKLIDYGRL